jgi:hypothetical protein
MPEVGWRLRLAPLLLALAALPTLGRPPDGVPPAAASAVVPCSRLTATPAWYQLRERAGARAELSGYELRLGRGGSMHRWRRSLFPESFAAGPFEGAVLVGTDDGTRSELWFVGVDGDCARLARIDRTAIIRAATLDPGRGWIYAHRIARGSRTDLGIWRMALGAAGAWQRVLPPLAVSDRAAAARLAPVFATSLAWSSDGGRLAIESCGQAACFTRLLEPVSGRTVSIDHRGELIGVSEGGLYAYAGCGGFPCPVLRYELGERRWAPALIATGPGRLGASYSGAVLAVPMGRHRLALLRDDRGARMSVEAVEADLVPLAGSGRSLTDTQTAVGWLPLEAPPTQSRSGEPVGLLRLSDGAIVRLGQRQP